MAAPKGNTYWKLAKGFAEGNDKKYSKEELWSTAIEYMYWLEKNPLKEQKVFANGKKVTLNKMRAATITGFCLYAGISTTTFDNYSKNQAYLGIVKRIKELFFSQKFEGAAADLLNSNIIARELGLADTTKLQGDSEKPVKVEQVVVFKIPDNKRD
ncbi:terminase small subunit [Apibacter muscae]|nr:terminase small subunit [Apibacter muscae]